MFEAADILIHDKLVAGWSETLIDFDNVDFSPVRGTAFVRLQVEWTDAYSAGVGGRERGEGYIELSIFVPSNKGTQDVSGMSDRLAAIFNKWDTGALKFQIGRKVRIGQQEEWFQEKVITPFTYDECNP